MESGREHRDISGTAEKQNPLLVPHGHVPRCGCSAPHARHWCRWHNDTVSLMMALMAQGDAGTLSQALPKAC